MYVCMSMYKWNTACYVVTLHLLLSDICSSKHTVTKAL